MAEQKISELPLATALTGTEKVPVNQNAVTSITDVNAILAYTLASQTIKVVKVTITSAQLLQMFTTPITLVAAQGAGKVIVPVNVLLRYRFGTIEYTTNQTITLSPNNSLWTANYNSAISGTADKYSSRSVTPTSTVVGVVDNLPLTVGVQIGNPLAGDGQLDVYVSYYVLTL